MWVPVLEISIENQSKKAKNAYIFIAIQIGLTWWKHITPSCLTSPVPIPTHTLVPSFCPITQTVPTSLLSIENAMLLSVFTHPLYFLYLGFTLFFIFSLLSFYQTVTSEMRSPLSLGYIQILSIALCLSTFMSLFIIIFPFFYC